jgi:hypothetical protein
MQKIKVYLRDKDEPTIVEASVIAFTRAGFDFKLNNGIHCWLDYNEVNYLEMLYE